MTVLTLPHPYATSPGAKIEHTLVSTSCQYGGDRYYNTMCGKHVHEEFIYFDDKTREPCFKCRQEQRKREQQSVKEAEQEIRRVKTFSKSDIPWMSVYQNIDLLRKNRIVSVEIDRQKPNEDFPQDELYRVVVKYYTPEQVILHQEDVDNARPSSHYEWYDWR